MTNESNYSYTTHQVVESEGLNLRNLMSRYIKRWPWFIVSVGFMLAGAFIYLLDKQPIYQIQASLLVQDQQKGSEQNSALKELGVFTPKQVVENEIEILRSFTLMNRVVEKLHLNVRYYETTTFTKRELYEDSPIELVVEQPISALYKNPLEIDLPGDNTVIINEHVYPIDQSIDTPYGRLKIVSRSKAATGIKKMIVQASKQTSAAKSYLSNLHVIPTGKGSTVILISLEDGVPSKGEAVINQLIKEYDQAAIMDKNKVAANTLKFIEDRLNIVSGELSSVERKVQSYKSHEGITDLSVQAQSFLETVQQNDASLIQVNVQLAALNDLQKYVENKSEKRGNTPPAVVGLNDPVLLGLITNLTTLEQQRDQLARTTSEQNPMLETINSQIETAENNMAGNILTMKNMLLSTRQQYTAKNGEVEGAIRSIPLKERMLMDITRQQAIKNSLYTYLLQKREETAVAFASAIGNTRTIDFALSDDKPIRPAKTIIYALFGLLGLVLPVAAIAGSDALNNRVTRRVDVEQVTHIPILGELVKKRHPGPLVISPNNQSVIAEQIRTLRACLPLLRNEGTEGQVILFTSSISGEGKSFVSTNLGMSLAYVDKPTVIIDMDLRMPKLHKIFNLENTNGVSEYLQGEATVDEVLTPIPGAPNYYVIPSGSLPKNPSELLSSPKLKQLIEELRERFDYIIIDTPPVGLVSDARLIAPLTDATFFMVRHDLTPKNHLKMIDKLYQEQRFPRLNIILNAVDGTDSYHYSGYNKEYAYGSQESRKKWLFSGKRPI
ncbi:GumC family protein [Spirosoma utsteinense]|uniref:non-specific protein-tyrosine kinase n=1 Tax=Spirosoma utsteinense TaxID=2585773 RepID=A0ABR6WDC9_9BACT|nr:tyrosine-protein kinase family protein [Spirosoma utsteinense]MBC3794565.1 capsular exopolysaccharide synthesis family protein [Spirosoma utsteinense]